MMGCDETSNNAHGVMAAHSMTMFRSFLMGMLLRSDGVLMPEISGML